MRITKVEPFHMDWVRSKSAWVRLWTDTGEYGLGEASPIAYGNASLEIIASAFAPLLLRADPLEHRVMQDRLFHQHIKLGPEGAYAGVLAAGEQEYTLQGIKRLIEAGVDIMQPDIVKTGGFTGLCDMAAPARAYGVDLVPYQTQPSVGLMANLHFVAALTHAHYPCEYNVTTRARRMPYSPSQYNPLVDDSRSPTRRAWGWNWLRAN